MVSEVLPRLMSMRNLTQDNLSADSGINKRTVQRMMNGEYTPNYEHLNKLGDALGVDPGLFFPSSQHYIYREIEQGENKTIVFPHKYGMMHTLFHDTLLNLLVYSGYFTGGDYLSFIPHAKDPLKCNTFKSTMVVEGEIAIQREDMVGMKKVTKGTSYAFTGNEEYFHAKPGTHIVSMVMGEGAAFAVGQFEEWVRSTQIGMDAPAVRFTLNNN